MPAHMNAFKPVVGLVCTATFTGVSVLRCACVRVFVLLLLLAACLLCFDSCEFRGRNSYKADNKNVVHKILGARRNLTCILNS